MTVDNTVQTTWRWWPYSTHTSLSTILTLYNNHTAQRLRSRVWFLCLTICAPLLIYQEEEEEEEWQAISAAPIHQLWTQVLELAILNSSVASAPTSLAPLAPSMPSFSFLTSLVLNTILSHSLHFFPHFLCCNLFFTSNCDLGVDFWVVDNEHTWVLFHSLYENGFDNFNLFFFFFFFFNYMKILREID